MSFKARINKSEEATQKQNVTCLVAWWENMQFKKRLEKIEEKIGANARNSQSIVSFSVAGGETINITQLELDSILKEIAGATRGLPSEQKSEKIGVCG